jgi:hypothetical protein
MMTTKEEKVYEDLLRRMARRQGFIAIKSRTRDPRATEFNGWKVVDAQSKATVAGSSDKFILTAEQVEQSLTTGERQ